MTRCYWTLFSSVPLSNALVLESWRRFELTWHPSRAHDLNPYVASETTEIQGHRQEQLTQTPFPRCSSTPMKSTKNDTHIFLQLNTIANCASPQGTCDQSPATIATTPSNPVAVSCGLGSRDSSNNPYPILFPITAAAGTAVPVIAGVTGLDTSP